MEKQIIGENIVLGKGLSIHCHHAVLVEYCTDYEARVNYIKATKPEHENELRLKLFKLLSNEAFNDLPEKYVKAYADWQKADADRQKAYADLLKAYADRQKAYADLLKVDADWLKADADRQKADADWQKADADWQKADADWQKADADWPIKEKEAFHKKWCGCKEWNGKELVF